MKAPAPAAAAAPAGAGGCCEREGSGGQEEEAAAAPTPGSRKRPRAAAAAEVPGRCDACGHQRVPQGVGAEDDVGGSFWIEKRGVCACRSRETVKRRGLHRKTGEPFRCTVEGCGKSFTLKSNLTRHSKAHEAPAEDQRARSHKCTHCSSTFATKNALTDHIRVKHSESAPVFSCPHCPYATKIKWHLRRHSRTSLPCAAAAEGAAPQHAEGAAAGEPEELFGFGPHRCRCGHESETRLSARGHEGRCPLLLAVACCCAAAAAAGRAALLRRPRPTSGQRRRRRAAAAAAPSGPAPQAPAGDPDALWLAELGALAAEDEGGGGWAQDDAAIHAHMRRGGEAGVTAVSVPPAKRPRRMGAVQWRSTADNIELAMSGLHSARALDRLVSRICG